MGNEPIEGVLVESPTDLAASPSAVTIGSLAAGETATATFTLPTDEPGQYRALFTVDTDDGGSDRRDISYEVRDIGGFSDLGCTMIEEMIDALEESDAVTGGRQRSLTAKLEAACDSLDRASSFEEDGRGRPAENQLDTATRQLGAFLNQLEAVGAETDERTGNGPGGGNNRPSFPEELQRVLSSQAEAVIDRVATAKGAV